MGKRSSTSVAKSGANSLSKSSLTASQSQKSSILKHAFAPSSLQLNLFASVVQGLEAQVLRIHDTLSGRLTSEQNLHAGRVSCLRWGRYHGSTGADDRPAKKRKTKAGAAEAQQGSVVVAVGYANEPRVDLYSPAMGKVVVSLVDAHSQGIRDFRFASGSARKAWSLGGDGKLVEWNLDDGSATETIDLPNPVSSSTLLSEAAGTIFTASTSIHLFETSASSISNLSTFPGFSTPIHSLIVEVDEDGDLEFVVGASEDEKSAIVFSIPSQAIGGNLVATTAIESMVVPDRKPQELLILVAVTQDGTLEIFDSPYEFKQAASKKAGSKGRIKRPVASLRIVRPESKQLVPISGASFDGHDLILSWVEGGVHPVFHRLPWRDSAGQVLLQGDVQIEKSKAQDLVNAKMNGLDTTKAQVDDTHTVIVKGAEGADSMDVDGQEVIDISSAEEEDSDEEEEDEEGAPATNGIHEADEKMEDADEAADEDDEDGEPTFGDKVKALAVSKPSQLIDVASTFPTAQTGLVPQGGKSLSLPSGMSLGTVLAQSLRTNDRELLETCFHTQELQVVRATIERLDSTLAGTLLEKLAERFHNRPGRAGSLQVWIQWTLVAHGGYLAGQPGSKIVNQLRDLYDVVRERAQALQPLLLLKGKLDMLEAQMRMRKDVVQRSRALQIAREEEEEDAIYVEGQEEESSDEEGNVNSRGIPAADLEDIDFDSDEDDEEMPTTMDVDDEEEDEDDEDEDGDGLIDDEAEETEDDSGLDDDIDHDDVDTADELDSESELEEPAPKLKSRPKVNGIIKKR